MIELLDRKPIRLRNGLKDLYEDLRLLVRGRDEDGLWALDPRSILSGYKKQHNPVMVEVHDASGKLKYRRYTHNLRTNDGIDWQARQMGGGQSTANFVPAYNQTATANIAITAPTGTTCGIITDTNTRVAGSIALNQFIGCVLVYFDTTVKYAHVVGNSAAGTNTIKWYFDNWFSPDAPQTTVAAPAANKAYMVIPGSPAYYIGLSTNSGAQAATDHVIGNITSGASAEIGSGFATAPAANGLGRVWAGGGTAGTWTHTLGTNTYSLKNVFTATGSFTGVQQCGMFTGFVCPGDTEGGDLTNAGQGGGVMVFENTFSSVNMASTDTLTVTWTVTY